MDRFHVDRAGRGVLVTDRYTLTTGLYGRDGRYRAGQLKLPADLASRIIAGAQGRRTR